MKTFGICDLIVCRKLAESWMEHIDVSERGIESFFKTTQNEY